MQHVITLNAADIPQVSAALDAADRELDALRAQLARQRISLVRLRAQCLRALALGDVDLAITLLGDEPTDA